MDMHSSDETDSVQTPRSEVESPLFTPSQSRVTPSPSRDVGPSISVGRPKKSPVWDYFYYDTSTDKSVCQVVRSSEASSADADETCVCGHAVAGKFPTNMKNHLKRSHPKEYQLILSKEESLAKEKAMKKPKELQRKRSGQMTLGEAFQRKYDTQSSRYRMITRRLAIFVGSTNVPNSLVENVEFQSLLETLDPRYPVPGRTLIGKEIDRVLLAMKTNVEMFLSEAHKISLCSDIWTKKGMSSSYLGVTAHFFTWQDHRRHRVTLAVRKMPHPHNAESIRSLIDEVLKEWNIPCSKICAILTDSASNMVKAFQRERERTDLEEESEDEEEEIEEGDESYEDDFEDRELDHDVMFKSFCKRLSCFAHTLQLVVNKFCDDHSFAAILKRVRALVKKMNKSSKATEMLLSLCHKKLVSSCPTRWSSTYLMIARLLEVRGSLTQVLEKLEWDNLAMSEWKALENIQKLLKPFAQYTSLVGGEEYTTLSSVIPVIMEINLHLEEMKEVSEMANVSRLLQSELKRRFRKYTDPSDPDHEPLCLMATMLDPRYRLLLNPIQMESTKRQLLVALKEAAGNNGGSNSPSSGAVTVTPVVSQDETEEPPVKRFHHLSKLLQERAREGIEQVAKTPPGKQELEHYLQNFQPLSDQMDAVDFWVENEKTYPLLSSMAVDILTIPGSSTAVERVFSVAGESTSGKRNRLADKNLEREVLIRKNKMYL